MEILEIPNSGSKTRKDFSSDAEFELYCIRHSLSHVLAQAVLDIFPESKLGVGPPVENGFYYDIDTPHPITDEDLLRIEKKMIEIIKGNHKFSFEEWNKEDAIAYFTKSNQPYKVELIQDRDMETPTIFKQDTFLDLCRGPHVKNTKVLRNFKLTSFSSAYWKGDATKASMQRIYGTAWANKEDLEKYLEMLKQQKLRDHRVIGEKLELFTSMPFSPGSPVLLPKGMTMYKLLSEMIRRLFLENDYNEVRGPVMCHKSLWETSGHWEKYRENMFLIQEEDGDPEYGLKPMNCPIHMKIFDLKTKSYRELPYRLHDQSVLHRNELSGALAGLTRLRMFCQDDTHIFLREEQIHDEIQRILKMVDKVYNAFELKYYLKLSTRPENYIGEIETWNKAEKSLEDALKSFGKPYEINEGDGAFYGPKIDLDVEDALGRRWQVATAQLDFNMPKRFNLKYIDENNNQQTPVVIHNAILGAIERFMAIIIESTSGLFPFWLAPEQVRILPILDSVYDYAKNVETSLKAAGIRCSIDTSNERISKKVRNAEIDKIPIMLIIGAKEMEENTLSIRYHGGKEDNGVSIISTIEQIQKDAAPPF